MTDDTPLCCEACLQDQECHLVGHAKVPTGYDRHGNATWICSRCDFGVRAAVDLAVLPNKIPPTSSQLLACAGILAAIGVCAAVALGIWLVVL